MQRGLLGRSWKEKKVETSDLTDKSSSAIMNYFVLTGAVPVIIGVLKLCPGLGMALGSDDEGSLGPVKPSTPLSKEIDCIDLDSD